MANLNEHIFGYYDGKVEASESCKLVNSLLRLDVCSYVTFDGHFSIPARDKAKFVAYSKSRMHFELSEPRGLYGFVIRNRCRYGAILAVLMLMVFFIFSSGVVWDIRISGNDTISDISLENSLGDLGLRTGVRWRKINKNEIETELLAANPDIAWISVNRRGTVAYVEVVESENIGRGEEHAYPFSNIIADRDGVIEEITVESGTAVVKVGDVVKKGELLISGIIESESGVTFCRAQGEVKASGVATVRAESTSAIIEKVPQAYKIRELRLIIFNFSVNIFKNYRNHENSCDIIKENRKIALFDKYRLPIRIEKVYEVKYAETERLLSEDEMTEAAKRELDGKIYSMFKNADVVKLRTQGEFIGDVYRITSRVVYSSEIGKESAIKTS